MREGRIFPGADDNVSGVVGMFEIAEALMVERPKRSVVFVWNTAEEKGLVGSYYFVQHCPVPVEKISANLNLDMISRNDTNHLYLIGSNKLSSELDASIQAMNAKPIGLKLDYKYESPGPPRPLLLPERPVSLHPLRHPRRVVLLRHDGGLPHGGGHRGQGRLRQDGEGRRSSSICVAMDIGNKPALLKLDLRPEVTARGAQNMKVGWR